MNFFLSHTPSPVPISFHFLGISTASSSFAFHARVEAQNTNGVKYVQSELNAIFALEVLSKANKNL